MNVYETLGLMHVFEYERLVEHRQKKVNMVTEFEGELCEEGEGGGISIQGHVVCFYLV